MRCQLPNRHRPVRNGWAVAYTRNSYDYLIEQMIVWYHDRGIWAGDFVTPETW